MERSATGKEPWVYERFWGKLLLKPFSWYAILSFLLFSFVFIISIVLDINA